MNGLLRIAIVVIFKSGVSMSQQDGNKGVTSSIRLESTLSERDQYIVIGCVIGFTLGLLIALVIGCVLKCGSKPKQPTTSEKDYNSLDKILTNDFGTGSQSGDRKLAKSAQMYHYQLSKQNLIELEKAEADKEKKDKDSDGTESTEECTVYECSGMGQMHNIEIRNPIFVEDTNSTAGENAVPANDGSVAPSKEAP